LTVWIVDTHRPDACHPSRGEALPVSGSDALIDFLTSIPQLEVVELDSVDLDGHPARVLDMTRSRTADGCGPDIVPWAAGEESFTFPPGVSARVHVVDVGGELVVAEIWAEDLASWLPIAGNILDSLRFEANGSAPGSPLPPDGTYQATIPAEALAAAGWPAALGEDGSLMTVIFRDATLTSTDQGGTCGADLGNEGDIVTITWISTRGPCHGEDAIRWELAGEQLYIRPVPDRSSREFTAIFGWVPFTRID
jgi:hypothetical protein